MQADKAPFEKSRQGKSLFPSVVIGIAYHKPGKYEEKVYRQIAMIETGDDGQVARKGIALEDVINYYKQGCHTTQPIELFIVRFGMYMRHCTVS